MKITKRTHLIKKYLK